MSISDEQMAEMFRRHREWRKREWVKRFHIDLLESLELDDIYPSRPGSSYAVPADYKPTPIPNNLRDLVEG